MFVERCSKTKWVLAFHQLNQSWDCLHFPWILNANRCTNVFLLFLRRWRLSCSSSQMNEENAFGSCMTSTNMNWRLSTRSQFAWVSGKFTPLILLNLDKIVIFWLRFICDSALALAEASKETYPDEEGSLSGSMTSLAHSNSSTSFPAGSL